MHHCVCRSGMSPRPPCCVQLSLAMLMSCGDNWERHGVAPWRPVFDMVFDMVFYDFIIFHMVWSGFRWSIHEFLLCFWMLFWGDPTWPGMTRTSVLFCSWKRNHAGLPQYFLATMEKFGSATMNFKEATLYSMHSLLMVVMLLDILLEHQQPKDRTQSIDFPPWSIIIQLDAIWCDYKAN